MTGQKIGYKRVSSTNQNDDRQLDGINVDKIFQDKCSGSTKNRTGLDECFDYTRKGDFLYVHSMDRLARNLVHLKSVVQDFIDKGVQVCFIKENLTFKGDETPMDNFLLNIIGAVSEFERSIIKERQKEGIQSAKKQGKHLGRFKTLNNKQIDELKKMNNQGITKVKIATKFNISRSSVYRYLKR